MSMNIFPAIDLYQGQCVRLIKGAFEDVTFYEPDPLKQAQEFVRAGATYLHVVDLEGAKAGETRQGLS